MQVNCPNKIGDCGRWMPESINSDMGSNLSKELPLFWLVLLLLTNDLLPSPFNDHLNDIASKFWTFSISSCNTLKKSSKI